MVSFLPFFFFLVLPYVANRPIVTLGVFCPVFVRCAVPKYPFPGFLAGKALSPVRVHDLKLRLVGQSADRTIVGDHVAK